jgi:hypothetical protein
MHSSSSSVHLFLFVFKNQFILCLALGEVIQVKIVGCHIHQPFPLCGVDRSNVIFDSQSELFNKNLRVGAKIDVINRMEGNYSKTTMDKTYSVALTHRGLHSTEDHG